MKYFFALVISIAALAGEFSTTWYIEHGFSVELKCKNGILIEVLNGKAYSQPVVVERQYCYDRSSWDSECKHGPLGCKREDKGEK